MAISKKVSAITHEVERIGPKEAEAILETNTKNRTLSQLVVSKLAEQMKTGGWNYDGSPIRIDDNGDLVDGQHRLWAVIESGTTQEFLVVRGVDEATMATMDTGKSRTFKDILALYDHNLTSVTLIAAETTIIYRYTSGVQAWQLRGTGSQFIPYRALLDFFIANREGIIEAAHKGESLARHTGATPSVLGLACWVFSRIDKDDADYFFERLKDGAGLEVGDPIYALREWLARSVNFRPRTQNDMSFALIVKAWNAYRDGNKVQILTWKRGGSNPQQYPEPH